MVFRPRKAAALGGSAAVSEHQHRYFTGHSVSERRLASGRIAERVPGFYVHEFGPGPRYDGWTYTSVGVWAAVHDAETGHGLEFVLSSQRRDERIVELLTITAYYDAGADTQRLGLGHTVPIGEPWLDVSPCDHLLVCLPYPYGPDLEHCDWSGGHARHMWLLPITQAERDYKVEHGLEALEQRLESATALPTDPARASVV